MARTGTDYTLGRGMELLGGRTRKGREARRLCHSVERFRIADLTYAFERFLDHQPTFAQIVIVREMLDAIRERHS